MDAARGGNIGKAQILGEGLATDVERKIGMLAQSLKL